MELDALDRALVGHLRHNGRASVTTLASLLGVTRGTVQTRLSRLVSGGVIRRFTIELDAPERGELIRAIMLISVQGARARQVASELRKRPEVIALHSTNGAWDYVADLETATLAEFDRALFAIREIPGILNSETCLLLDRVI